MSKFKSVVDAWFEAIDLHPSWRRGQALFNVLHDYNPALAEQLRVSDANPFYDDANLTSALSFISDSLEE
jgi:hypothetical protein